MQRDHKYFYDTQAWIPKNVTLVNTAVFEALDSGARNAALNAGTDGRTVIATYRSNM